MIVDVLELDVPNKNNRIYSQAVIEKALAKVTLPLLGSMISLDDSTRYGLVDLSKVSHSVTNLYIEEGILKADIHILDTPYGNNLIKLLEKDVVGFRPTGIGKTKMEYGSYSIYDYDITSIDYTTNPA